MTNIPHGPDHGASRIVIGPDGKLYASRGDHGSNFLAYHCEPIRAQELPTAADIAARNWQGYEGKILRVNLDGSIPDDNPVLERRAQSRLQLRPSEPAGFGLWTGRPPL